jgi:bifunctional DNase/RNase
LLFYFDQLTIQEIAALLDISISAVKVRLHRSRQQLRLSLASLDPEPTQTVQPLSTTDPLVIKPERKSNMVKVTVADVINQQQEDDASSLNFLVVLLDKNGKRLLPIWIGPAEGMAMALNLLELDLTFARPVTYVFVSKLLEASGVDLENVSVSALSGDTYYSTVTIRIGETVREIDARPSDAINLALQMGRPIYVAESVMEKAAVDISDQDALPKGTGLEQLQQDWDERMQRGEEKKRALRAKFADLSDEERDEYTEQMLAFILGAES